jgi:RNA polymerase sigma-70 factor (ECF subfamily)
MLSRRRDELAERRLRAVEDPHDGLADPALVSRLSRGDQAALAVIYDRHASVVYSIAINVLRDPELAQDVTHDVFINLWSQPDRYNPSIGPFAPWFYRVARNRAIDVIRRRNREVQASEPQVFELTLSDNDPLPSELAVERAEAARVRAALATLPDEQRVLLELAYFGGLSQSQMAEKLDLPLGTVKTRVRTALRRLRDMLEGAEIQG